jgi:hypothetical protein
MNHTRFQKDDLLPDWARRDDQVNKGDCVEYFVQHTENGQTLFGTDIHQQITRDIILFLPYEVLRLT